MEYNITFNCFHGTIKHYSDEVMSKSQFTSAYRDDHWLGNGVYFYINDKEKAIWWSKEAAKKARRDRKLRAISADTSSTVIYLETSLDNKELLDLDNEDGQKKVSEFIHYLEQREIKIVKDDKEPINEHKALCTILDLLVVSEEYKACSYTFEANKKEMFKGLSNYGITNKSRQLSVFDQKIIDFKTLKML